VLCEGACVFHARGEKPIKIGLLQRHAMDWAMAHGKRPFERGERRPGRVAVIGAGPAGLACAAELLVQGIEAVVFEAGPQPGGLNTTGIAEYKLTASGSLAEVKWLTDAGVDVRYGSAVGEQVSIESLDREFDAIFVGAGLGKIGLTGLPGDGLPGMLDALDFIEAVKLDRDRARRAAGRRMVVIGGGNTSIDVVTQAARLGVEEVTLVYRRSAAEMPAYKHEVELARQAGCRFVYQVASKAIVGTSRVEALELDRVAPVDGKLVPTGETLRLDCDSIVVATGQKPRSPLFTALGLSTQGSRVVVDDELRTNRPSTWAGGDCITGGKEVVDAVAQGKRAAQSIARTFASLSPSSFKEAARG
jgi:glutamate synthase (NADPH/NADH) small chain